MTDAMKRLLLRFTRRLVVVDVLPAPVSLWHGDQIVVEWLDATEVIRNRWGKVSHRYSWKTEVAS